MVSGITRSIAFLSQGCPFKPACNSASNRCVLSHLEGKIVLGALAACLGSELRPCRPLNV